MEASTYPDKKYIESSRMWVNVAAHSEKTHQVDAMIAGKRVTVCSAYWNIPCEAHSKCYGAQGQFEPRITGLPTTVYTDVDGKEIGRAVGGKSASELIKMQKDLLEKIPGEKISADEWNAAKKLIEEADSDFAKSEWKKAVEGYRRVSKMARKVLKDKGTEGLTKLDEKGKELIAEAKGKIETDKEAARKILRMVINDFKGLTCEKEATAALKEIPADEKK
ncbi:MAG TPA: hypothetical protein VFS19_03495 [Planctomycetota bacterium]|nr:hypothetical protein [Planctomycetota bacterium]